MKASPPVAPSAVSTAGEVDPLAPAFWRAYWQTARAASPLRRSQEAAPGRWREFYERVGPLYLDLWGQGGEVGRRAAAELARQGLLAPGVRVLDVGAGPGTLAVPLALAGAAVTALDYSPAMLAALAAEAAAQGAGGIATLCRDWEAYHDPAGHDLVVAACFPEAMSPEGLARLEGWSRGWVALLLGTGRETFPFRRALWERIVPAPAAGAPAAGCHLMAALGWLVAAGRRPGLSHLSFPAHLDEPVARVAAFYRSYFAIFGQEGPAVEAALAEGLAPWRRGDRLVAQGEAGLALVWWRAPGAGAAA